MIEKIGHKHIDHPDEEYVEGIQRKDRQLILSFYEKLRRVFFKGTSNYGLSASDREDLFQDSYIIVWEKIESSLIYVKEGKVYARKAQGTDEQVPELSGYFMRVVKNKSNDLFRRNEKITVISDEVRDDDILDLVPDDDPEVMRDRIVNMCVMSLPESCKEILLKFYYEGKSLDEIVATRQNTTSYDGLKTRKSKCMRYLKERIIRSFQDVGLHVPSSDKKGNGKTENNK